MQKLDFCFKTTCDSCRRVIFINIDLCLSRKIRRDLFGTLLYDWRSVYGTKDTLHVVPRKHSFNNVWKPEAEASEFQSNHSMFDDDIGWYIHVTRVIFMWLVLSSCDSCYLHVTCVISKWLVLSPCDSCYIDVCNSDLCSRLIYWVITYYLYTKTNSECISNDW